MKTAPMLEIVVTARPSWARSKTIAENYRSLFGANSLRISLVGPSVSSRYGNLTSQIESQFQVKHFSTLHDSDSLESVALSCIEGSSALARSWALDRPDCVLVIADRTETLGVSLAASLMQIPLIHLQGGEVSGSIDDKIRDTNSKLADFHLTTNDESRDRLIAMNEPSDRIRIVGCPSLDLVQKVKYQESFPPLQLESLVGVGDDFSLQGEYGIVMFHPDTLNETENDSWIDVLISVVANTDMNWFWFWPNPDHGTSLLSRKLRRAREMKLLPRVKFLINLLPENFIQLACSASVLIGNSSFGIREASYIGLPVIDLGRRQSGRGKSRNVVSIPNLVSMSEVLSQLMEIKGLRFEESHLYGDGDSGVKCARAIGEWSPSVKTRS
jgi:UDP-hydrolysing UDP-N-acetyl-D-glucosamine 2-epimerase